MKNNIKNNLYIFSDGVETPREAPESLLLLSYGTNRYTRNGERGEIEISPADARSMLDAFNAGARDVVIDYEHQTLNNDLAPAAGWIESLEVADDGVRAKLRGWTEKARKLIADWEYRYISPVVETLQDGGKRLHSVALTNHPALHGIPALVANDDADDNFVDLNENPKKELAMEKFQKLAKSLGIELGKDIDEAGAIAALESAAESAAESLTKKEEPPKPQVDAMSDLKSVRAELEKLKNDNAKIVAESAVARAKADGKLADNMVDWATRFAFSDITQFEEWAKVAPKVKADAPKGGVTHKVGEPDPEAEAGVVALTDSDKEIYRRLGYTAQEMEEYIKTQKKESK